MRRAIVVLLAVTFVLPTHADVVRPVPAAGAASGGGASVAGADTQVQYNDGGAFGGDAGLTFNETTNVLTTTGANISVGGFALTPFGATTLPVFSQNITFAGPTAARTYTLPDSAQTLAGLGAAQSWTAVQTFSAAPTLAASLNFTFSDNSSIVHTSITGGGGFSPIRTAWTPDSPGLFTGTLSNSFKIVEIGDSTFDFSNGPCGVSACTSPTLIGHSQNQTTTEWWSITHNATDAVLDTGAGGLNLSGITGTYKYDRTVTAAGTTGAQTINKTAGTVNFAATASTLVVTNSLVTADSIVLAVRRTNDATCTDIISVAPAAGSFTIQMNAACTAETSVGFFVTN